MPRRREVVEKVNPFGLEKSYADRSVEINPDFSLCTCFSNKPGSWPTLIRLWLYSIIGTYSKVPLVNIVYTDDEPLFLNDFKFVRYSKLIRPMKELSNQALFNFYGKPQALSMASSTMNAWSDCDIVFTRDHIPTGNSFIIKKNQLGGGFFSLRKEDLGLYLSSFNKISSETDIVNNPSDQKIILKAVKTTNIQYQDVEKDFFIHLDKKQAERETEISKAWMVRSMELTKCN